MNSARSALLVRAMRNSPYGSITQAAWRVWIAKGVTDMRRGVHTLALKVQQGLGRDPHAGEIFGFRERKGSLVKRLWRDGVGMSLYTKRLEAGKFIWPTGGSGDAVQISAAQLGYLLEGIDWRNPPLDSTA